MATKKTPHKRLPRAHSQSAPPMSRSGFSLTDPQSEILQFIKDQCLGSGHSPSYREIQEHFGYKAVVTVQDHVKALLKKGALEKATVGKGRRARGLLPAG